MCMRKETHLHKCLLMAQEVTFCVQTPHASQTQRATLEAVGQPLFELAFSLKHCLIWTFLLLFLFEQQNKELKSMLNRTKLAN